MPKVAEKRLFWSPSAFIATLVSVTNVTRTINWPCRPLVFTLNRPECSTLGANAVPVAEIIAMQPADAMPSYVKCLASRLALWTDAEGYRPERIADFFSQYGMPEETRIVVDYCNQIHRQDDLVKWAYDAYNCATVGRIGEWVHELFGSASDEESTRSADLVELD